MKKLIISFIILVNFLNVKATNYYFSTSGNDANSNIQARNPATPWATYGKLNSIFSTLLPGDSALFKRGETFYTTTTLTLSRSGTLTLPINIGAYGAGSVKPVITSLLTLTWSNAGGNLWRSNEVIGLNSLNLVTVNNTPQEMGRWPNRTNGNNGYNTIINTTTNSIVQTPGAELTGQPLIYPGAIVVYRPEKFWMGKQRITAYNAGTRVITFALATGSKSPKSNFGYFIQHDSLTLDQQGEWWYNERTKRLKMYSAGSPAGVKAANIKMFVYGTGKSYINISDLNFNGCDSDAVRIAGGSKIKIQNCTIENVGRTAIKSTADDISILGNTILNSLSKGILIQGGARSIIRNNIIRNTGQLIGHNTSNVEDGHTSHSGVGIYVAQGGADIIIENNHVINSGHNGIHMRHWDRGKIRYNYIDSVDNILDDGGGIYTYEGLFNRDELNRYITGNIILNGIGAPEGGSGNFVAGAGVAGLYFDLGSHDIISDSNFVAGFGQGTLFNFGANHITLRNNTFYNNSLNGIQINTKARRKTRDLVITNNTVIASLAAQKTLVTFTDDGDVLNQFGTIDSNIYARPLDDNLTMQYSSGKVTRLNLNTWKTTYPGYDQHSIRSPFLFSTLAHQNDSTSFFQNTTGEAAIINVADTSQDFKGLVYAGSSNLGAYKAIYLVQTGSSAAPPEPPQPPIPPLPASTANILYTRLKIQIL